MESDAAGISSRVAALIDMSKQDQFDLIARGGFGRLGAGRDSGGD